MSLIPKKSKHYKLTLITIALIEHLRESEKLDSNTTVIETAIYNLAKDLLPKTELESIITNELKLLNIPEQYWKG